MNSGRQITSVHSTVSFMNEEVEIYCPQYVEY